MKIFVFLFKFQHILMIDIKYGLYSVLMAVQLGFIHGINGLGRGLTPLNNGSFAVQHLPGAILIWICCLTIIWISIIKIRRSHGRVIFIMEISCLERPSVYCHKSQIPWGHIRSLVTSQLNDIHLGPLLQQGLTHWSLWDLDATLKIQFSGLFYWLVPSELRSKRSSDEWYRTLLTISQHWFR